MGRKEVSESAREREVFRYYQPTLGLKPQDALLAPQSSNDATLTAFAQLGALRLNAKRGLISLVAREHQYIIAEATRTLSLQSDDVYEEADALWKGETIVPRNDGPSAVALDLFTGVIDGEHDFLVVNDMSSDDRFAHMESVNGPPHNKFYVAVPLVTAKGSIIGAFYVLDDKPRNGITNTQMSFMKDISSTIMSHLEAKRIKKQHQRAERMIRGLGLYIEGKSSLREWWLNTGHKTNNSEVVEKTRRGESLTQQADETFGIQDAPDISPTSSFVGMPSTVRQSDNSASKARATNRAAKIRPQYAQDASSDTTGSSLTSPEARDPLSIKQSEAPDSLFSPETSISNHDRVSEAASNRQPHSLDSRDETSGARLQEAVLSNKLKESFSRAGNLIRESIGVEGVLFLDASVGTFGGSSTKSDIGFSGPGARNSQNANLTTSSSEDTRSRQSDRSKTAVSQKTCGILGYSTSSRSSLNMHEASALHLNVAESFLQKLLRRYPHGKVFDFHEDGSLSSSEDEVRKTLQRDVSIISEEKTDVADEVPHQKRKKKRMSREAEAKEIATLLPGSRSVAFFPLWDSHRERWFSGSIVWSKDPTRILDPEEDLTYLASFGNSIMAEISRLDALSNSQLKTSFVSSISHELRSPLHGLLASVEFLQDSPMNALQQDMANIIGSCGRTLLDTINHVLDFTKFKTAASEQAQNHEKPSRRLSTQAARFSDKSSVQTSNAVDLRLLMEEVLEGVYAGSGFGKSPSASSTSSKTSQSGAILPKARSHSPLIIVSVDWRSDWGFDVDPGAWRRLVMNVFGNSFKYTEAGFIRVSLGCGPGTKSSTGASSNMVTLTVADSGKGISKEFLNHHLYTPFAQEDALAVGSGLGLSIVRHIVDELGGSIVIESELESGTDVKISLPLSPLQLPAHREGEEDFLLQIRKQVQNLETCLVGFDVLPSLVDEPTGILSLDAKRMFYFKDSLIALFRDWFSMKVTVNTKLDHSTAMVSVIMESTFNDLLTDEFQDTETGDPGHKKSILLVLCAKPYKSYSTIQHRDFDVNFVQQPIGPHKLATILARCLASQTLTDQKPTTETSSDAPNKGMSQQPVSKQSPAAVSLSQRPALPSIDSSTGLTTRSKTRSFPNPPPSSKSDAAEHAERQNSSIKANLATPLSAPTSPSSGWRVLLVEDNAINLKLLVTYMQKLGVEYATAENGLLAVQEYESAVSPFNLVLMDISMPVMDGLEASRKIRVFEQDSNRDRVPIVAITGAASESERQEAFSAGIDMFLTKPASLKVLREIVDQYSIVG